jgi:serine/threonine protein kinase/formylglycine-generating enzyme required for sulfatase activity
MADERDRVGELFHGKYRILSEVGVGGFGTVYEARDERGAGNKVAIKVLRRHAARSPELMRRFKREARHLTRLHHPNIVDWKVFDEDEQGTPYFVMELVEGDELHKVLKEHAPLPWQRVAELTLGVLDALHAAHDAGLLHLDLKPRNVFVVPGRRGGETVRVIDFGIAQYVGGEDDEVIDPRGVDPVALLTKEQQGETDPDASMVTLSVGGVTTMVTDAKGNQFERSIACTANYVSPEQGAHVLGHDDIVPLDGRADLFSVGLMAYEMLTGKLPYDAVMMGRDILPQHVTRAPHLASEAGVKAPRAFLRFLDKLLAFEREDRWPNSKVSHDELQKILRPAVVGWLAPMLGVVVASLAFAGWQALQEDGGPRLATAMLMRDLQPLSQTGLALGPETPSATVDLASIELDRWGGFEQSLQLVDQRTGDPVDGWAVRFDPPGAITISADHGDGEVPIFSHAMVRLDGGPELMPPFELAWLGEDMWTATARVAGVELEPGSTSPPRVDGADMGLELVVAPGNWAAALVDSGGAAAFFTPMAVRAVRVSLAGDSGDPSPESVSVSLRSSSPPDGLRSTWSLPAPKTLEMGDGIYELSFELTDLTGATRSVLDGLRVEVVSTELRVEWAELHRREADGTLMGVRSVAGQAILTPTSDVVLVATVSRPAVVRWRLLGLGSAVLGSGESALAESHQITLAPEWFGGEAFVGTVEVVATDEGHVLRGDDSDASLASVGVLFHFQPHAVALVPSTRDGATWEALPAARATDGSLVDRGRVSAARADAVLQLEVADAGATDRFPLDVTVRWVSEADGVEVARHTLTDLRRQLSTSVDVPVTPEGVSLPDGRFRWDIEAIAVDLASQVASDEPEWRARYDLLLDRGRPTVSFPRGRPEGPVRQGDPLPPPLMVLVEDPLGIGSLAWSAWTDQPNEHLTPLGELADSELGSPSASVELPWPVPEDAEDGHYGLEIIVGDLVGNQTIWTPEIEVSRHGPLVTMAHPLPHEAGSTWTWLAMRESDVWSMSSWSTSPFGTASVEGEVRTPDGSLTLPLDLTATPQELGDRTLLSARIPFDWRWSEAEVEIAFHVADRHGTSRGEQAFRFFRLPPIAAPRPEAVAVAFGDHEVQPMRLVPGNADRVYVFGGRNDARENVTFVEAGWPLFNPRATGGSPRGWEIEYQRDEIGDFYLDEREVTVGQFLEFLSAEGGFLTGAHWATGNSPVDGRRQELLDGLAGREQGEPVTGVSWDEAHAYASWVGKRLPSLVEWEFAVRGSEYRPSSLLVGVSDVPSRSIPSPGEDLAPGTRVADLCSSVAEWTGTPESFDSSASSLASPRENLADHRLETLSPGLHPGAHSRPSYWVAGRASAGSAYTFDAVMPVDRDATLIDVGFRCAVSRSEYLERLGDLSEPRLVESRP